MVQYKQAYHRFQYQRHDSNVGIRSSSSDVKKIFASKGPNGDPIATPSHWIQKLLLQVKCNCLVQRYNNSFKTLLGMFVWIFFSSYTFFKIKHIVLSRGTLVNRFFTSKEIILYTAEIVSFLSLLVRSSVFKML